MEENIYEDLWHRGTTLILRQSPTIKVGIADLICKKFSYLCASDNDQKFCAPVAQNKDSIREGDHLRGGNPSA